jgi:phage repressor protein C with HTH and peptisase S24 domain
MQTSLRASVAKSFAMKTIGEQAKEFRLSKAWNTTEMARAVGTSRQNIESLEEKSDRIPRYLVNLAKAMGVSTDDLHKGKYSAVAGVAQTARTINERRKNKPDEFVIPQFDTGGAMGDGLILRDQPGVIQSWHVNQEWVQKNIKSHTSSSNLCIVTGFGDSMKGMFNSGDPLVVDRGVKAVDFDAVYFFRVADEGFIKRLQRIPGEGLRVLSENKKYDSWTIKPDMDFEVFGRVVKAWQGEDF